MWHQEVMARESKIRIIECWSKKWKNKCTKCRICCIDEAAENGGKNFFGFVFFFALLFSTSFSANCHKKSRENFILYLISFSGQYVLLLDFFLQLSFSSSLLVSAQKSLINKYTSTTRYLFLCTLNYWQSHETHFSYLEMSNIKCIGTGLGI